MKLLLASKSKLKLAALQQLVSDCHDVDIITVETETVVEQPIGMSQTEQSCKYRIKDALSNMTDEDKNAIDFIVSLENGIIINDYHLCDFVVACIYSTKLKRTFTYNDMCGQSVVYVPKDFGLDQIMLKVTNDVTFGELVSKQYPEIPHNNWMKTICGIDRVDQLKYALTDLVKTMKLINDFKSYQDFPRDGILFRDIIGVLSNRDHKQTIIDMLCSATNDLFDEEVDYIIGLDARGFILGGMLSTVLPDAGFIPIRKANKLPGACYKVSFEKEYGTDEFELQKDAIKSCDRKLNVLIVDDILATCGTIKAAIALLNQTKVSMNIGLLFLDEVDGLNPDLGDYPTRVLLSP